MKPDDRKVLRGAVLRQLRSEHGIHLKLTSLERTESSRAPTCPQSKLFGVPLQHLQMRNVDHYGLVPCFLVNCCKLLLKHAGSEGLFRKSGSVVRLKALRARLDKGEDCLSTSLPCDAANLVKQFFYELPSPVFPAVLLQAFTKAQRLATDEERSAATLLVSCLVPETNLSTLRFFFSFLKQVSLRASENKMDSYNLSVVFTPNLFQLQSTPEWNDEFHRLHIAVICTLIDNAYAFGVVPDIMIANDAAVVDSHLSYKVVAGFSRKSKERRSSKVLSLSKAETPNLQEKILSDGAGEKFPSKKRKSLRRSLGMVPSVLFGCCYDSSSRQEDSSPSVVRHCSKLERKGCSKLRRSVKRVMSNTFCCGASSPIEKSLPDSPVASCWLQPYQDTPVGLCLKKQISVAESVSKKTEIRSVFKNLFCASATDSPEDQKCLTQDEITLSVSHSDNASVCLGVPPLKDSSAISGLDCQGRQVVDADQRQVNKEKEFFLSVKRSKSKLLSRLTSNLDLSPSSGPLIALDGGTDTDACKDDLMEVSEFHPCTTKTSGTSKLRAVHPVEKYNKLQLKPAVPKVAKVIRSPLKFHRTPVYQYVKRINSHLKCGPILK
uniref:Rho GTPase activating protein 11A n=1 Tax=Astyanax mexicanus TaxID=7994 RepID=A0A3B1KAW6_ASTMX